MPAWCSNKLKISGNKTSMKNFFDVLNSENNSDFQMEKFSPTPEELLTINPFHPDFYPIQKIDVVHDNGKFEIVVLDEQGRTEEEFDIYLSDLEARYNYNNWYDWRWDNWGCKWDVCNQQVINTDDQHYDVFYDTPYAPNISFIEDLHLRYSNISFTLDYYDCSDDLTGTLTITPDSIDHIKKSRNQACFNEDLETNKYIFDKEFANIYLVYAIGEDWINSLSKSGFTINTVKNWDIVVEYFNSVFKQI
jgi:hypothetical protein